MGFLIESWSTSLKAAIILSTPTLRTGGKKNAGAPNKAMAPSATGPEKKRGEVMSFGVCDNHFKLPPNIGEALFHQGTEPANL